MSEPTTTPTHATPDPDEFALLSILAGAGDNGTYVEQCYGDYDRPLMLSAADTDLPEQLLAWHRAGVQAEHDRMQARIAELETERDDDLTVMTVFLLPTSRSDAWWHAILANHFGPRCQALTNHADRFAAARSRINDLPKAVFTSGPDCNHGSDMQCVSCVPDDGSFRFQPLGGEGSAS